ncbi:hypothetical protein EVAR_33998_1 [Eumeta japonica]|uniref:Mos1 transposase HTH domain-containing protein n=1 Tax=Eumeta variegata TaxID=151549 RepID=A0A4C1WZV9_EUMVA|nr:hypothetical protein EVAR_33998_1 [Eumeta japonica]
MDDARHDPSGNRGAAVVSENDPVGGTIREGKNAAEDAKRICDLYKPDAVSVRVAQNWFKRFQSVNFDMKDQRRSGRLVTFTVGSNIKEKLDENHSCRHKRVPYANTAFAAPPPAARPRVLSRHPLLESRNLRCTLMTVGPPTADGSCSRTPYSGVRYDTAQDRCQKIA